MKKYNKPEIVALALETVDVIATSVEALLRTETGAFDSAGSIQVVAEDIKAMDTSWSW